MIFLNENDILNGKTDAIVFITVMWPDENATWIHMLDVLYKNKTV